MIGWLARLLRPNSCWLHGHDQILQFADDRLFLKCQSCARESPGWQIELSRRVKGLRRLARFRKRVKQG